MNLHSPSVKTFNPVKRGKLERIENLIRHRIKVNFRTVFKAIFHASFLAGDFPQVVGKSSAAV